jgi:hypothetical protein
VATEEEEEEGDDEDEDDDYHRDHLWLQGQHGALSPLRIGKYKVVVVVMVVEGASWLVGRGAFR